MTTPRTHQIQIIHGTIMPSLTTGVVGEAIRITNLDNRIRIIAFGPHEHHITYDGVTEQVLYRGDSMCFTLTQSGTYTFHDHIQDVVSGTFIVKRIQG